MILKTQSRKKPSNSFKRLLKQRIFLCAFQNSKVRRDKEIFWCVQLKYGWLNCFVAKGISCLINSFCVGYVNTRAIDHKLKSKTCLKKLAVLLIKDKQIIISHFYLINIHIFDYPDSRLSGLFTEVPMSPDNRGSTVLLINCRWWGRALWGMR